MKTHLQSILSSALAASALAFAAASASAAPVSVLAYKLGVNSTAGDAVNAATGWTTNAGFNEANATAQLLTNNSLDYKNSFVDTDWALVLSVQVAMYSQGVKVSEIDFKTTGTNKTNFFSAANVTSTTYTDTLGALFFGVDGDPGNGRNWFIENNYGGCNVDQGHWVAVDRIAGSACDWENDRKTAAGRAFLYSTGTTMVNWNNAIGSGVGSADVFAVFVTVDRDANDLPEPASLALAGVALAGLGLTRKRAQQKLAAA